MDSEQAKILLAFLLNCCPLETDSLFSVKVVGQQYKN